MLVLNINFQKQLSVEMHGNYLNTKKLQDTMDPIS